MGVCRAQKLRRCRYCGADAEVQSREGRSFVGETGYVAQCVCKLCKVSVWAWSKVAEDAINQAIGCWNGGERNGEQV